MITQTIDINNPQQKHIASSFETLNLSQPLHRAIKMEGYTEPTPIQAQVIPHILAGRDLQGCAQTGTGKTAAFALPVLHHLAQKPMKGHRKIRALAITPTRELAIQIRNSFIAYGRFTGLRTTVVHGGVNQNPQTRALLQGVDILVATPGRLLDLMNQGFIDLKLVETFILDEADRMFDMGFVHDVRRIVSALPSKRQTLLFSATMPAEIQQLAASILTDPVKIQVAQASSRAEHIEQSVYLVDGAQKLDLLCKVLNEEPVTRALIFTRTKHGADRLVQQLDKAGLRAESIHGDKTQSARQKAISNFSAKVTPILVATDLASRGLDISEISHVVNFDMPSEPETYVHRIGRTARAGASGIAVSFCSREERRHLFAIEKLIRETIPIIRDGSIQSAEPFAGIQPTPTITRKSSPSRYPRRVRDKRSSWRG
jgi:ATP-dependent RNA helicase RhlE